MYKKLYSDRNFCKISVFTRQPIFLNSQISVPMRTNQGFKILIRNIYKRYNTQLPHGAIIAKTLKISVETFIAHISCQEKTY